MPRRNARLRHQPLAALPRFCGRCGAVDRLQLVNGECRCRRCAFAATVGVEACGASTAPFST